MVSDAADKTAKKQLISIQIAKDYLGFSAGHFTIFSATRRERLHGHSFRVRAEVLAPVDANGLAFDYTPLKRCLKKLCDGLDERLLLPAHSPHLDINTTATTISACFDGETMTLPIADVLVLPIKNITIEELAPYFLQCLLELPELNLKTAQMLTVGVSSSLGQWGECHWMAP